jgi:phage-related tail protein
MRRLLAPLLALALSACSVLGTAVPQTPRQQLYALEVSYTAAVKQANGMASTGLLKGDDLTMAMVDFQAASKALDAADAAILAGNTQTIVGALSAAQTALNAFTAYLVEHQK